MDVGQEFCKKIVFLNERVLQNLMKETSHSNAGQLNYLFINIAKKCFTIKAIILYFKNRFKFIKTDESTTKYSGFTLEATEYV